MTSNHHAPYGLGYTRTTMASTKSGKPVKASESHKGHDDLTSSPPSSDLSPAVSLEFPSYCWLLKIRVALVAGLNPTSHDTS